MFVIAFFLSRWLPYCAVRDVSGMLIVWLVRVVRRRVVAQLVHVARPVVRLAVALSESVGRASAAGVVVRRGVLLRMVVRHRGEVGVATPPPPPPPQVAPPLDPPHHPSPPRSHAGYPPGPEHRNHSYPQTGGVTSRMPRSRSERKGGKRDTGRGSQIDEEDS